MIWLSVFRFPASGGWTGFFKDLVCLGPELQGVRPATMRREIC